MKWAFFLCALAAAAGLSGAIWADEGPAYPDFTFRRVAVPQPGSGNRIKVQIDPATQLDALPPIASAPSNQPEPTPDTNASATPPAQELPFGWYWDLVSPNLADASSGRLEEAVNMLEKHGSDGGVPTPRLQHMQDIANRFGKDILLGSIGTRVSPALALAVIGVESAGRSEVVSPAGATGLMQLIPATAERFGVTNITDPADNIRGGIAYLDWLMGQFDNDPVLVLAAYNAGENAVRQNNGVPDYAETRAYVPKVLAAWTVARGLCLTPPELISDGCVFSVQEARSDG